MDQMQPEPVRKTDRGLCGAGYFHSTEPELARNIPGALQNGRDTRGHAQQQPGVGPLSEGQGRQAVPSSGKLSGLCDGASVLRKIPGGCVRDRNRHPCRGRDQRGLVRRLGQRGGGSDILLASGIRGGQKNV